MQKKGQMQKLSGFALGLVVFAVVLAVGLSVLSQLNTNLTAGTAERNATSALITHMGTIPGWVPIIIVATVGGIVLFLVVRGFGGK